MFPFHRLRKNLWKRINWYIRTCGGGSIVTSGTHSANTSTSQTSSHGTVFGTFTLRTSKCFFSLCQDGKFTTQRTMYRRKSGVHRFRICSGKLKHELTRGLNSDSFSPQTQALKTERRCLVAKAETQNRWPHIQVCLVLETLKIRGQRTFGSK